MVAPREDWRYETGQVPSPLVDIVLNPIPNGISRYQRQRSIAKPVAKLEPPGINRRTKVILNICPRFLGLVAQNPFENLQRLWSEASNDVLRSPKCPSILPARVNAASG